MSAAISERLDAICGLLPELGKTLREMQSGDLGINSKSTEVDLVTRADFAAETLLLRYLQERFPDDAILSEEGGANRVEAAFSGSKTGLLWVLDPIDGTVNYANGLPLYCVSIALMERGEEGTASSVGGLVFAPALDWTFRAERGSGAWFNGSRIAVNQAPTLRKGLVATGFPYNRGAVAETLSEALTQLLKVSGGVRRLGSAALDICLLARGDFVAYYEVGLKPWDTAAATLIAEEAGAKVTDFNGKPFLVLDRCDCAISNAQPDTHPELLDTLQPLLTVLDQY